MKIRSHPGAHVGIEVVRDLLLALPLFLCGMMVLDGFHAILAIMLAESVAGMETEEEYRARVRPSPAPEADR